MDREIRNEDFTSKMHGNYMIPETQTDTVTVVQANDVEVKEFGGMMVPRPCAFQSETLKDV